MYAVETADVGHVSNAPTTRRHVGSVPGKLPRHGRAEEAAAATRGDKLKPLSLKGNISWTAVGSGVEMLCHWGRVVILAQFAGLEMLGMVVLAFAVCAPVNALACLGLRGAVATDAKHDYRFGDYLALRLVTATAALLVIVGMVLAAGHRGTLAAIILLVASGEWFKSLSDIFHALEQQHERMDRMALAMIIRGPLVLGLLALGITLSGNVVWGMAGFPLAMGVTFFAWDVRSAARLLAAEPGGKHAIRAALCPQWHLPTMFRLAWLTLPLGIVMMLMALQANVPRYLISHYLGHEALGVFVSIFYLAMIGSRAVAAVAQSAGPRLAKYYAGGNGRAFLRLLLRLCGLVVLIGAAAILVVAVAGRPLFALLYGLDYTPHLHTAVWLMVGGALMYLGLPLGMAIDAMRRFKTHALIRGVGVAALAALLPGMLHVGGLLGAAWAVTIAFGLLAAAYLAAIAWPLCQLAREQPSAP